MARTTMRTMMLFLGVCMFPTSVLGQVTACSIGENWGVPIAFPVMLMIRIF